MVIEINRDKKVEVNEDFLIVKNKRLYNTKTKSFEGIDGDIISFEYEKDGHGVLFSGVVNGYTCDNTIYVRGVEKPFEKIKNKKIDHVSSITNENVVNENLELLSAESE